MEETVPQQTYDDWSGFYDATFGRLVARRQQRAVYELRAMPGQRVLDIGIGTGATLPHFPKDVHVVGLDLSEGMLRIARKRASNGTALSCDLIRGDAMEPPFAPESFDHLLITHVVTVVPDPPKLISAATDLVKPGGRVVVLNHFRSTLPVYGRMVAAFNSVSLRLGWRCDLTFEDIFGHADPRLKLQYRFKLQQFDFWQIAVFERRR